MGLLTPNIMDKDSATIDEGMKDNYDSCGFSNDQSSSYSSSSSPLSASIHSHTSFSSDTSIIHNISTHSSLNSLPSLTLTYNAPFSNSFNGLTGQYHNYDTQCEYHCVATLFLDTHVSSLVSAGDYLYGGSSSTNTIYVWLRHELHKGNVAHYAWQEAKLGFGDGAVRALAAVGLDKVVSAHDHDNKMRAWKISTVSQNAAPNVVPVNHCFKLLTTMPTIKDYLKTFLLAKNYVQVRRHHKRLWIEHVDAISALAVSKDGQLLYSASWDRSIKVWRLADFKCVESVWKAHDDAINCLALSHDGKFVYTGSADAKIKVWAVLPKARRAHVQRYGDNDGHHNAWSAKTKSIRLSQSAVSILEGHKSAVNALVLSPDGSVLYSGAGDKAIIVWEREESAEHMVRVGALRGHRHAILCLETIDQKCKEDPQMHMLCSGSADKTIRIWRRMISSCMLHDTNNMQYKYCCVCVLEGHMGPVRCLSVVFNDDPVHYIYSASSDKTLKIWRVECTT